MSIFSLKTLCNSLRYWGGLYPKILSFEILLSFSPLRYWGGLYLKNSSLLTTGSVLVPFDIGVVYIKKDGWVIRPVSFSPLRYWGGLYHKELSRDLDKEF